MLYTIEKTTTRFSCDQKNVLWNVWYSLDYFKGQHNRMTLSIGLSYYKETCITFCPYFSNEPFSYQLSSTVNYIKIITSLVGIFLVLFSSNLINRYGIAIYFKYVFIASIFCFFSLGVIATYWYGEPSERSITLVSNAVKFFGVLLIVFAQSDHWPSVLFIVFALIVLSSISFCLQTFNFCKEMCNYLLIFLIKVKSIAFSNTNYLNKTEVLKPTFPLISKEEFELQYLNTPRYLIEIASVVRADPIMIRRIKRCNRAVFALFCLDPEGYFLTKNDEIDEFDLSDDSETTFYSDSSDHDEIAV